MCFSFWGTTKSPRPPTGAPPMDPAGGLPSPRPPHLCSSKISLKSPEGAITSKIKRAIKHKTSPPARLAQLLHNCCSPISILF